MFKKIGISIGTILVLFLFFVSSREGKFRYAASGMIKAPAAKVFPYLSDLKLGSEWSPFEKGDTALKREFVGPTDQVGSKYIFTGGQSGSGEIEILKIVPNQLVELKLTMTSPLPAENIVQYSLSETPEGTRFTWTMSGDGGFVGKLMNVFINCEKMITDMFQSGIVNLQNLLEEKEQPTENS